MLEANYCGDRPRANGRKRHPLKNAGLWSCAAAGSGIYGASTDAQGAKASVEFDGLAALYREEHRRDVMGFFHTHPDGPPYPSARDIRTMRAWCSAFGKPLLCAIASPLGLAAFQFSDDRSDGMPMLAVEIFPRGVLIGVEPDGEQVSS